MLRADCSGLGRVRWWVLESGLRQRAEVEEAVVLEYCRDCAAAEVEVRMVAVPARAAFRAGWLIVTNAIAARRHLRQLDRCAVRRGAAVVAEGCRSVKSEGRTTWQAGRIAL